jgi:hypothetical protein
MFHPGDHQRGFRARRDVVVASVYTEMSRQGGSLLLLPSTSLHQHDRCNGFTSDTQLQPVSLAEREHHSSKSHPITASR